MSQSQQEQSEAKLLAYIEGELDAEGRAEIEKHLEAHPQHRKLLEDMHGMRDWVRWLPRESAPPEISESFQGHLERAALLGPPDDHSARVPLRISGWPQIRMAAAVAALAVGLGAVVYFSLPKNSSTALVQPSTRPLASPPAMTSIPTTAPGDTSYDFRKQAETREALAIAADGAPDRPVAGERSAARPVASTEREEMKSVAAKGQLGEPPHEYSPLPATQPAVVESAKAIGPAPKLAEVASDTFQLVNSDPRLTGLLTRNGATDASGAARPDGVDDAREAPAPTFGGGGTRAERQWVMVVLAADTDRARKQIGDYLADHGIAAQVVTQSRLPATPPPDPAKSEAALAPTPTVPAAPSPISAPAAAPAAAARAPVAGAAEKPASTPDQRRAATGGAIMNKAARSEQAAVPTRLAPAPAPAEPAQTAPLEAHDKTAAAPAAAVQQEEQVATTFRDGGLLSSLESNGDVLIARRMTTRQARDLKTGLESAQWAAVYTRPMEQPPSEKRDMELQQKYALADESAAPKDVDSTAAIEQRKGRALERSTTRALAAEPADALRARGDSSDAVTTQHAEEASVHAAPTTTRALTKAPAPPPAAPPLARGVAPQPVAVNQDGIRQRDRATTNPAGLAAAAPAPAPAAEHQNKEFPTTAPAVVGDDQPVDIVIVLQQSPPTAAAAPTTLPTTVSH